MSKKWIVVFRLTLFIPTLVFFSSEGFCQGYPNKPIRWIMTTGPGGGHDIVCRILAPKLREGLGQPLVIDNRPGAGTTIGIDLTAKAPPDGYTMVTASQSFTINVSLYNKLPYDTENDLATVTLLTTSPYIMVLHPSVPAKSLKEFIALAKANPGRFNYSTTGNGTSSHLMGELFNIMAGVKTVNVPYKGGPPAYLAVVSGEVNFGFQAMLSAQSMINAGKLKALAVAGAKRLPLMPDLPTMAEAGIPGFDVSPWYGILVPGKTPKPIISRLHAEFVKVLRMPEIQQVLSKEGVEVVANTPEEFTAVINDEIPKWAKVIKQANIKIE